MKAEIMSLCDEMMGYTPAVFKTFPSVGPVIEYYAYNAATAKLERQRIRLKREQAKLPKKSDFMAQVHRIIVNLNGRLAGGWSPFGISHDVREFTPANEAFNLYIGDRKRELRNASMVSYSSLCNMFIDWLTMQHIETMPISHVNKQMATRYMDALLLRPKFNNNTYNSHLKKYRAIWSWFVEHNYAKENPFEHIKARQKVEKQRGLIPADARERVLDYVRHSKYKNFEIVMHLVYSSLIRPAEIERLQVRDIDIQNHCVHLTSDKTKTHKERYAPLTDDAIAIIEPMIRNVPGEWYLLGTYWKPAKEQCYHGLFKKRWEYIRDKIGLPKDMQLYSLKDSGITELLESGLDALTVMKAADHHDLTTTTKYASHRDEGMIAKVRGAGVSL